jgi:hypothetical protein
VMLTDSQTEWTFRQQRFDTLDLTVELTSITDLRFAASICATASKQSLVCDRCQAPNELVVTVLEIAAMGATMALCGLCTRELPAGFQVA